jgi:SAM-dependent methyltransferase
MTPSTAIEPDDPYSADGVGTSTLELLEAATRYNAWVAARLEPFLGRDNLELGAGNGTLTALVARGRGVTLTEPSTAGRRALAGRFADRPEIRAILPGLADLDSTARFDAVYSANVLEHVEDDAALMRETARFLREGGRFVAIVPAGRWLYSRFDARIGHHRRYGRADRDRLASAVATGDAPMKLRRYETFNPVGALGWFLRMRVARRVEIAPRDALVFDRLVPLLRQLDRAAVPFGQSLLMVFERIRQEGSVSR